MKKLLISIFLTFLFAASFAQQQFTYSGHSTSLTDTYTVSITNLTSYGTTRGVVLDILFDTSSSGAWTLNVNGLGAITGNGTITANTIHHISYNINTVLFDVLSGGGGSSTYAGASPTTVTVGGLASGSAISGNTYDAIIQSIVAPYVNPAFSSFSISGQATTVEVGTTLSGSKTFTWGITLNSGAVSLIDLYDITAASTLLSNTPNDGSQAQTVTTIQLNSNGANQSWRGVLHDTNVVQNINSSPFTVTSRFYRFFGETASSPANSAAVRALPSNAFHTGATTFTMATGTTAIKFVVALPPGVTISSVIDTGNLNANITSSFVLTGTINVLDAGGTNRAYNIYEYNIGSPYPVSSNLSITTAN